MSSPDTILTACSARFHMRNSRSRATFASTIVTLGALVEYVHASRAPGQTAPDAVVFQPAPAIDGALTEAGIEVITAGGRHLGVVPVWCITRRCQNLTFGGPDKRTLYVAGGGTLLRIPMLSRGFGGRAK